ncbi:DUF1667 domain-containing protein [Isachenkonia alkalipeptolytica]|uniref:DUF1667 domain-containing protein n=1 Tax=Isachenkonia alkalipeptolytica TaxID=2565777 RepID=A0AA44BDT2_9CLOT|nr:DUF1667 domain-containing protein [Isachenkonia alkalipeptolytica]NBG88287.1 DUF1667 domain-containing protein [Isachenkonia alkalipeptolytica]
MDKKEMICIVCPVGCHIEVVKDGQSEEGYTVSGNQCLRGKVYGVKEMTNPTRVLTTTVKITEGSLPRLPVTTKGAIPKELMMEAMEAINRVEVNAPATVGQVIIKNLLDTGVDLVATRSMEEVSSYRSQKVS